MEPLPFLFDVDGVAADFMRHLLTLIGSKATPTSYQLADFLKAGELKEATALKKTPEFWLTIPVMDGAQEGIEKLKKKGHAIRWVTRSYRSCPMWWDCRLTWLEENFGVKDDHEVICAADKGLVMGRAFVDDRVDNVSDWEKRNHNHGRAFLFDQPYNQDIHRTQRVTWKTMERIL
jgi:5'(3')-deoxyribonucleotidase